MLELTIFCETGVFTKEVRKDVESSPSKEFLMFTWSFFSFRQKYVLDLLFPTKVAPKLFVFDKSCIFFIFENFFFFKIIFFKFIALFFWMFFLFFLLRFIFIFSFFWKLKSIFFFALHSDLNAFNFCKKVIFLFFSIFVIKIGLLKIFFFVFSRKFFSFFKDFFFFFFKLDLN